MKRSWTRGWASSHFWTAGVLCADSCRRSRGWSRPGSTWGRSRPGTRGTRWPGAARTACRSPCRWRCSARRTGRWCRAGRSRGCAARACRASSAAPARSGPGPGSGISRRRTDRRVLRRARYRPTTSRTLSMSSGSVEILKSSVRHGCSPKDRQIRSTLDGEIPTRLASSRLDQCVAPSGVSSRVRHHHLLHLGVGDGARHARAAARRAARPAAGPGTGPATWSPCPGRRPAPRPRDVRPASAQAKTIRARSASPCAVFRRFAQPSSSAARVPTAPGAPACYHPYRQQTADHGSRHYPGRTLKLKTTHVAISQLKTGSLGGRGPPDPTGG